MSFDAATPTLYSLAEEFKSLSLTVTKLFAIFFNIGRYRQKPVFTGYFPEYWSDRKKFHISPMRAQVESMFQVWAGSDRYKSRKVKEEEEEEEYGGANTLVRFRASRKTH